MGKRGKLGPGPAAFLGAVMLVLAGCESGVGVDRASSPSAQAAGEAPPTSTSASSTPPLRIAAAADLQRVLPSIVERFQARTGQPTSLTFDASGRLAEQIKAGAPFDLYLAANRKLVADLAAAGLIEADSIQSYATGTLVLCVHEPGGDSVRRLEDLDGPGIRRIAIANPEFAPYGVAARQALERSGLWPRVESRVVRAASVSQALFYARKGDAEAALVSASLADVPDVRVICVAASLYDPLIQAMGIVAGTRQHDRAAELSRFIMGAEGQAILREHGFAGPEPAPRSEGSNRPAPPVGYGTGPAPRPGP